MKNRQPELQTQRQHAGRKAKQQRRDDHHIMVRNVMLQRDIKHRCRKGDACIQLFLKDQGDTFAEHIAQYAAKHPCDHSTNGADNRPSTQTRRDR